MSPSPSPGWSRAPDSALDSLTVGPCRPGPSPARARPEPGPSPARARPEPGPSCCAPPKAFSALLSL